MRFSGKLKQDVTLSNVYTKRGRIFPKGTAVNIRDTRQQGNGWTITTTHDGERYERNGFKLSVVEIED